jgi:tyrosine-protein kinase Etk/Wzc
MSDDAPGIDYVALLLRRSRTLLAFAALGAAAGVVYGLVVPPWYAATLSVIPSQRSQDAAAMSLVAKLPIALDSLQTDVPRIQAVLRSNSVADQVIAKFKLLDRYDVTHIEQAREKLWNHCSTDVDRKSSVVAITCEDKDPRIAMDVAAYFGEVGNQVFGRVSVSSAREERKFLEGQVEKARRNVDDTSRKLREFQEAHKLIDLPEQSKAVISAMAQLHGEVVSKQLELSYLSGFSSRNEAGVLQLQQQISILQAKLKQLENAQRADSSPGQGSVQGFFPNAMSVPQLRFELEQLMRDQKIEETVFALMTQRYEMAKVDEARDTSTFQILDHPTLPSYKSRPKAPRSGAFGFGLSLLVACAFVLIPVWWRKARTRIGEGSRLVRTPPP